MTILSGFLIFMAGTFFGFLIAGLLRANGRDDDDLPPRNL